LPDAREVRLREVQMLTGKNAKRVSRTYVQHVPEPPGRIFPLLCPVREHDWVPGWTADVLYSDSGYAEDGCVFRTEHTELGETVWTITRRDESSRTIEFALVSLGKVAGRLQIALSPTGEGTACSVTYTFTSLGPEGDAYLDAFTADAYAAKMERWERAITHYLATGTILGHDA
jgi:hypothetical protein